MLGFSDPLKTKTLSSTGPNQLWFLTNVALIVLDPNENAPGRAVTAQKSKAQSRHLKPRR